MIEIQKWLEGKRNFQQGKILYDKFGYDDKLKRIFQRGKCKKSQIMLERELSNLLESKSLATIKNKTVISKIPPKKELAPELVPFVNRKKEMYVIATNLHNKMSYSQDQEERKNLAVELLRQWRQINEMWKQIDYFEAHGKLMPDKEEKSSEIIIKADKTDILDMYERWKTLATYISKAKKKKNADKEKEAVIESNLIAEEINKIYGYKKINER